MCPSIAISRFVKCTLLAYLCCSTAIVPLLTVSNLPTACWICTKFSGLIVVVVCSGLTSLSTIFQLYHDGVWLRRGAQCSLL